MKPEPSAGTPQTKTHHFRCPSFWFWWQPLVLYTCLKQTQTVRFHAWESQRRFSSNNLKQKLMNKVNIWTRFVFVLIAPVLGMLHWWFFLFLALWNGLAQFFSWINDDIQNSINFQSLNQIELRVGGVKMREERLIWLGMRMHVRKRCMHLERCVRI